MPALHRMPVFYLLLLVGLGLSTLIGRGTKLPPEPDDRTESPRLFDRTKDLAEEEPIGPPDGILRTVDGLRRKVLVKNLSVVCRSEPVGGKPVGPPLDYFAIQFVYGVDPLDPPTYYQVGPKEGPPQGWVPASEVLEWDTRLLARPTPREGRPALVLYRDESCLVERIESAKCSRHADRCPTEGEEPEEPSRIAPGGTAVEGPTLGFPILKTRSVGGRTIHEVASLVKDQAKEPIRPTEPPPDLRPYLKVVDIAFVMDTTASMKATIDDARRLAADLVATASKRYDDVSLRFALVEYRDEARHYGFKARRVTSFTSPSGFLAALERIQAASHGDGTVDETVFDGLELALPAVPGEPASRHVEWPTGRAGELATKLIVVIGDAPDHDRGLDRVRSLAARARSSGITIATVGIDRPGSLSRDERARYSDQWRLMAEESYRPLSAESKYERPVMPLTATVDEGGKLAERLQSLIDDRVEHARTIAALATAEAEGRLGEYVNSKGLSLDRVAPVLVDLHRGDAARVARPDPRSDGRKAPSVRRGWIAERLESDQMIEIEILMTAGELKSLIDELTQFQQAASGTARDLSELLEIGTAAASGETSFLAVDRGHRTFAEHLRRRQGLPPARPESLLRRSQADLLQSDDLTLAALDKKLRESLARLSTRLLDTDWQDPQKTIDGMALVPFEAIDF
ncbi:vWA domain-containing protein [Tundrisphaera lichenicola]|uniref:vWA domain-containing protein n=1 Tax=Tundrisphaera lichenicola TaxID=2029860 RepID=UPI003EBD5281